MKNQTSIEWLIKELNKNVNFVPMVHWDAIREIVQKALAMEKQQIIEAYEDFATNEIGELLTGEQYYNQTYNK